MSTQRNEPDDFSLNHLDVAADEGYDKNLLEDSLIDAPGTPHPTVDEDSDAYSMEPDEPPFTPPTAANYTDPYDNAAAITNEEQIFPDSPATSEPKLDTGMSEPQLQESSATVSEKPLQHLPLILASVALLFSIIALMIMPADKNTGDQSIDPSTDLPAFADLAAFNALQQRITELESNLEAQQFSDQILSLQIQVSDLKNQLKKSTGTRTQAILTPRTPTVQPVRARAQKLPAQQAHSDHWIINLASVQSHRAASKEQARLKKLGITAEISPFNKRGQTFYRLHSPEFQSLSEANTYKSTLASKYGIKDAWTLKLP